MSVSVQVPEPTQRIEPPPERASDGAPPPLRSGDRLSRDEFERRYWAHPEIRKAELIEGVVYVDSPLYLHHGEPHARASAWLGLYWAATPGIRVTDNTSLRLDERNEPQPDIAVYLDPQRAIPDDDFVEATPVLVVEIAASSAAYDLHDKKEAYRRNRVPEYLVFLAHEQETRWFRLPEGAYVLLEPDDRGILHSQALPGLWLDPARFWEGDLAGVLAIVQEGLTTEAHAAFTRNLA